MSSSVQRIGKYLDLKGIKVSVFEKKIGMSNASFGKSLKNNKSIGVDKVENILKIYNDINPVWLLTGVGEMLLSEIKIETVSNVGNAELLATQKILISMQKEEISRLRKEVVRLEKIEKESEILKNNKMFLPPKLDASIPKQAKLKKLEKDT